MCVQLFDRVKLGEDERRSFVQRFINGTCWLISVSRNAIIIILGSVIAGFLSTSADQDPPFAITGKLNPFTSLLHSFKWSI